MINTLLQSIRDNLDRKLKNRHLYTNTYYSVTSLILSEQIYTLSNILQNNDLVFNSFSYDIKSGFAIGSLGVAALNFTSLTADGLQQFLDHFGRIGSNILIQICWNTELLTQLKACTNLQVLSILELNNEDKACIVMCIDNYSLVNKFRDSYDISVSCFFKNNKDAPTTTVQTPKKINFKQIALKISIKELIDMCAELIDYLLLKLFKLKNKEDNVDKKIYFTSYNILSILSTKLYLILKIMINKDYLLQQQNNDGFLILSNVFNILRNITCQGVDIKITRTSDKIYIYPKNINTINTQLYTFDNYLQFLSYSINTDFSDLYGRALAINQASKISDVTQLGYITKNINSTALINILHILELIKKHINMLLTKQQFNDNKLLLLIYIYYNYDKKFKHYFYPPIDILFLIIGTNMLNFGHVFKIKLLPFYQDNVDYYFLITSIANRNTEGYWITSCTAKLIVT